MPTLLQATGNFMSIFNNVDPSGSMIASLARYLYTLALFHRQQIRPYLFLMARSRVESVVHQLLNTAMTGLQYMKS